MTNPAIALIKSALPLPVLIQEYATVKQGRILCPWHKETHPSCRVYNDHLFCYVCGHHGDIIDIVATFEHIGKGAAIQRLSDRTGIPLDGKRPTRTQVAYDKDAQAFTDWWWTRTGERLARRLTAYARMETEEQADGAGLAWRTHTALTGQARRHACLRMATARERAEWKFRMAWDKETAEMMVKILEAA